MNCLVLKLFSWRLLSDCLSFYFCKSFENRKKIIKQETKYSTREESKFRIKNYKDA